MVAAVVARMVVAEGADRTAGSAVDRTVVLAAVVVARRRRTAAARMQAAGALEVAVVAAIAAGIGGIRSTAPRRIRRRRERMVCRRGISSRNRVRLPSVLRRRIILGRNRLMRGCPRWDA